MLTTAVGEETTAADAETTAAAEGETTAADATTAAAEGSGSGGEAAGATTAAAKPKVVIKLPVTTTLPPPAVCKCLGDDELLADVDMSTKILTTCLDFKQRVTSDGMGNIAEKYRCGTRTPDNPTKDEDSICFCMEKEEKVKHFHWVMLELRDMNARHRWNTYDYISKRLPFNYLQEPKSKIYIDLKEDIEEIFNTIMINTAGARDKGFVRTALMRFNKGSGCIECPTSTTTTTTTTTTTQNITTMETTAAPAAGGGAGGAEGSGGGAGEEAATTEAATTAAEGARKRRNAETTTVATTTTTQIVYDSYYVQAFLEFQFMKEIDAAYFETMFEGILDSGTEGFNLTHMNASYPEKNTCGNKDLTDLLPTHMKSMKHDKEMSFINVTQKYPNGTLKTDDQGNTKYVWLNKTHIAQEDIIRLSVGEDVNLECKDPLSKPSADQYDLDPYDGIITAVCQPDEVDKYFKEKIDVTRTDAIKRSMNEREQMILSTIQQ